MNDLIANGENSFGGVVFQVHSVLLHYHYIRWVTITLEVFSFLKTKCHTR